jgi:hypothetical protein
VWGEGGSGCMEGVGGLIGVVSVFAHGGGRRIVTRWFVTQWQSIYHHTTKGVKTSWCDVPPPKTKEPRSYYVYTNLRDGEEKAVRLLRQLQYRGGEHEEDAQVEAVEVGGL